MEGPAYPLRSTESFLQYLEASLQISEHLLSCLQVVRVVGGMAVVVFVRYLVFYFSSFCIYPMIDDDDDDEYP